MCALGLRPISFLEEEELTSWGNDSINTLIEHFGREKIHEQTKSVPLINGTETRTEWSKLKIVVKTQGYPRKSTAELWGLIYEFHKEDFPNLVKLAQLAIAHPVHTADCERAFSTQNAITTSLRNRLSADHIDSLMRVCLEGGSLEKFDFKSAVTTWSNSKTRKIKL